MDIKIGLKGILERVPPRKNASKPSQNVFYVTNIVFSVQICIE